MKPGRLDQRVTIRETASIDDGYGGTLPGGWADGATVWASVEPLKGGEAIENMQITSRQTWRVWLRSDVAVTPANRLLWDGTELLIREAPAPRRGLYRQLVCEEVTP